jgi:hypothetical protein
MMDAIPNAGPDAMPRSGSIRKIAVSFARRIDNLGVAGKIYSIVALLVILTTFGDVDSIGAAANRVSTSAGFFRYGCNQYRAG